jgi:Flp pilus assembly protein TadD
MLAAGILISFTYAACERNSVFKTPVTLWADASLKSAKKRRTHENYGQALSAGGMYGEAIREFETVIALDDDRSVPPRDLYRELGVVYFRLGRVDDAIVSWQTGLRFAPGDPGLLNNLSVAFIRKKRYDDAEAMVRQALQAAPAMPHLLNTMGEILMEKGKYEEALRYFLAAIQSEPDTPSRYWNAALAFEKTGRYDMAYEYANRFTARETNPLARQRAVAYMNRLQSLYFPKGKP